MKYILRKEIHNETRLNIPMKKSVEFVSELINSGKILYNEKLNIHYKVCDCYTLPCLEKASLELRIIIDVIEGIEVDNDTLEVVKDQIYQIEQVYKLLPTKRPEKFVGEKR